MNVTSGTRLGPYEVLAPLGAGGMGEVWKARDTRLERSVAIKVLPADFAENAQLKLRFEREAKTISQLNHPNICTLFDVGHDNGVDYLVMELIEGESLADRLTRGPLPMADAFRYGTEIAEALDKAHRQGVVHRDLKPGNVMLTKSGAKLVDFGLAKSAVKILTPDGATMQKSLTAEGTIVGTFQYMSPEQLEGLEADPRTDIFALGAVLYEMATGRRAFEGKTRYSLIAAIVSAQPTPISQLQPLTPPAFEHVVHRCLQKDPADRWQSANDIAEELKWIRGAGSQAGVATPIAARRKTRERLWWVAALLGTVLIATAARYRAVHSAPEANYRFTIPMIDEGYKLGFRPMISPDGKQIVFFAVSSSGPQLFLRRLDNFSVRALPGTENATHLCWAPDSNSFLATRSEKLLRVNLSGGALEPIAEVGNFRGISSNQAGDVLIGQEDGPLLKLAAGSSEWHRITTPDPKQFERGHVSPYFLPDGNHFLFITLTNDPTRRDYPKTLYAGALDSKDVRRVAEITSRVAYARGWLFFVRNGALFAEPFDATAARITGKPELVADEVQYFQPNGSCDFTVSDDGTVACQSVAASTQLTWLDAHGKPLGTVGPRTQFGYGSSVSRDGSQIFVGVQDPKIGTFDLWSFGLTRATATRLTFEPTVEVAPVISPDGTRVYYSDDRKGALDIFEKGIDGAMPVRLLVQAPNQQNPSDISPDGKYLLYESDQDVATLKADIYVLPLGGGEPFPFVRTPAEEWHPQFSPDGKWVSYASDVSGRNQIYVKPFPRGTPRQVSTERGGEAHWSADGHGLYFRSGRRNVMRAEFAAGGTTSEPRLVFTTDKDIDKFHPMADGRFLTALVDEREASPPARVIVRWPDSVKK